MNNARLGMLAVLVAFVAGIRINAQVGAIAGATTIYYVASIGNDLTGTPNDPAKPYRSPRRAYSAIPTDTHAQRW